MPTARDLRAECTNYFDEQGLQYEVLSDENNVVGIGFLGSPDRKGGGKAVVVNLHFNEGGEDAEDVTLINGMAIKVSKDNYLAVLEKLNEANQTYRWVRFFITNNPDGSGDIWITTDNHIYPRSAGETCFQLIDLYSQIAENTLIELGDLVEITYPQAGLS